MTRFSDLFKLIPDSTVKVGMKHCPSCGHKLKNLYQQGDIFHASQCPICYILVIRGSFRPIQCA